MARRPTFAIAIALTLLLVALAGCVQAPGADDVRDLLPPETLAGGTDHQIFVEQTPGGFEFRNGEYVGTYATVRLDADGAVEVFLVRGLEFFERIDQACPCQASLAADAAGRDTRLIVSGQQTALIFLDHPTAHVAFQGQSDGPAVFDLISDVVVSERGTVLELQRNGQRALLAPHAEAGRSTPYSSEQGRIVADGPGSFVISDPDGLAPFFAKHQAQIEDAVVTGRLGAQVQVLTTELGNEPQVLPYEDLEVEVDQSAELTYEIKVDAELSTGRAFLFQFPLETLPAESLEIAYSTAFSDAVALERAQIVPADSLEDALEASPDEDQAEYYIEATSAGYLVAVTVPHFSIQLFQIVGIPPETAPLFAYAVVFVFLFLGVGTMGAVMGNNKRAGAKIRRQRIAPFDPGLPAAVA